MDFLAAAADFQNLVPASFMDFMAGLQGTEQFGSLGDARLSEAEMAELSARIQNGVPLLTQLPLGSTKHVYARIPLPSPLCASIDMLPVVSKHLKLSGLLSPSLGMQELIEAYPFPVQGLAPYPSERKRGPREDMYNHPDLRWLARDVLKVQPISSLRHDSKLEDAKGHRFCFAPEALLTGQPYFMLTAASCFKPFPFAFDRDADLDRVMAGAFQVTYSRLLRLSQEMTAQIRSGTTSSSFPHSSASWQAHEVPTDVLKWVGGGGPTAAVQPFHMDRPQLPCNWEDCVRMILACLDRHESASRMMTWEGADIAFACERHLPTTCRRCTKLDKSPVEHACVSWEALAVCHVQTAHCCVHGTMTPLPTSDSSVCLQPRALAGGQANQVHVSFPAYAVTHNGILIQIDDDDKLQSVIDDATSAEDLLSSLRQHLSARWSLTRTGHHILSQAHINAACAHLAAVGVPRPVVKAAVREALQRHVSAAMAREAAVLGDPAALVDIVLFLCDRRTEATQMHTSHGKLYEGVQLRRGLLQTAAAAAAAPWGSPQHRSAMNTLKALRLRSGLMLHKHLTAAELMTIRGRALAANKSTPPPRATLLPPPAFDVVQEIAADEAGMDKLCRLGGSTREYCRPPTFVSGTVAGLNMAGLRLDLKAVPFHARGILESCASVSAESPEDVVYVRWLKTCIDPPDPDGRRGFIAPLSSEHFVGEKSCLVPSQRGWFCAQIEQLTMGGHLFISSAYEDLRLRIPALVFRPGVGEHIMHPALMRRDPVTCTLLAQMLLTAFLECSSPPPSCFGNLMAVRREVSIARRMAKMFLDKGDNPSGDTFVRSILEPPEEIWLHRVQSNKGPSLDPCMPPGSCYPAPAPLPPFANAAAVAEHAREVRAMEQTSGCEYERIEVDPVPYTVLQESVHRKVRMGRYR